MSLESVHELVVHEFSLGDVEDPDLYAAQPLIDWQNSEQGKFVMSHAVETPIWQRQVDPVSLGHRYYIVAKLNGKDYTFWWIKYQKNLTKI
jgi:hypothetical protein